MNTYGLHLVIVAGGLGSRLSPMTDHIPKFLVNIGKNTGYVEMIRYWRTQIQFSKSNTLTVIVHSQYASLVYEYHKMYFSDIELIVKCVDVANGSAHAILSSCSHLEGEEVLFVWCDVIPRTNLDLSNISKRHKNSNVVFLNYNNSNRYDFVASNNDGTGQVSLSVDQTGGCFGMYYLNRFNTNVQFVDGQDFIDVLHQYGPLCSELIQDVLDFGDLPKLRKVQANADTAREFNTVEFKGDFVLKQATNEQGVKILEREMKWYRELENLLQNGKIERPNVPEVWFAANNSGFFMSRVFGESIWKVWDTYTDSERLTVLTNLVHERKKLYDLKRMPVSFETVLNDVSIEGCTKLMQRFDEIKGAVEAFGEVKSVNGWTLRIPNYNLLVTMLYNSMCSYYESMNPADREYGFIHGDLQMSNSMVDESLNVTIIDPRGYFGKTGLYGLQDYDDGKLLYALNGYDAFNCARDFGIRRDGSSLNFIIKEPNLGGVHGFIANHFKPIHYAWLAVNFLGLAQYIKNDPVKMVAAHYHGIVLAERWLVEQELIGP